MIVDNGMIGGRMLMVFVVKHCGWQLFLSEVSRDCNARACRERLLTSGKTRQRLPQGRGSVNSRFVGRGIAFGCEYDLSTLLGRYSVTVERQIRLDSDESDQDPDQAQDQDG